MGTNNKSLWLKEISIKMNRIVCPIFLIKPFIYFESKLSRKQKKCFEHWMFFAFLQKHQNNGNDNDLVENLISTGVLFSKDTWRTLVLLKYRAAFLFIHEGLLFKKHTKRHTLKIQLADHKTEALLATRWKIVETIALTTEGSSQPLLRYRSI